MRSADPTVIAEDPTLIDSAAWASVRDELIALLYAHAEVRPALQAALAAAEEAENQEGKS